MKLPRVVYAITHNRTGRVYVGSTYDLKNRFSVHLTMLKTHKHPVEDMQRDYDQYGNDFSLTVLDTIKRFDDRGLEYEWMEKFNSYIRGVGYNYKDRHFMEKAEKKRQMCVTENERALIDLIRGSEDPTAALVKATEIICEYLAGEL